jgi:hypothetical protein
VLSYKVTDCIFNYYDTKQILEMLPFIFSKKKTCTKGLETKKSTSPPLPFIGSSKTLSKLQQLTANKVLLERSLALETQKVEKEEEKERERVLKVAKTIRIGKKDDGLWKEGQVSAHQAARLSGYRHQYLTDIANRYYDDPNESPFHEWGRPSLSKNTLYMESLHESAADAVKQGNAPRVSKNSSRNKSSIPGSAASLMNYSCL